MKNMTKYLPIASWIVLCLAFAVFAAVCFQTAFIPKTFMIKLSVAIVVMIIAMGLFSFFPSDHFTATFMVNLILAGSLIAGSVFIADTQKRMNEIFREPKSDSVKINAYVLSAEFPDYTISDMKNSVFITQTALDQENQAAAVKEIEEKIRQELTLKETADVLSAVNALYEREGQVLLLNEALAITLEDIPEFSDFSEKTRIIYTYEYNPEPEQEEIVEEDPEPVTYSSEGAFSVFVAGSDTRYSTITTQGRTDVDMVLTINPNSKQVLIVSIPRDYYIENPALGNGLDKLTHLGNHGIKNTIKGINEAFGLNIKKYAVTNFAAFQRIIDAVGGIDIENPYAFSTKGSNGGANASGSGSFGGDYEFAEGNIHLDGNQAIAYVRERYSLDEGDFDRNEHQMIVLGGLLKKLTSGSVLLNNYRDILDAFKDQVVTNLDMDSIYGIAADELSSSGDWNLVSYHLGGYGDYQPTASMGSRLLYVVWPFESQLTFAREQTEKVLNGEVIVKEKLPDEDYTVYKKN